MDVKTKERGVNSLYIADLKCHYHVSSFHTSVQLYVGLNRAHWGVVVDI